MNKLFPGSRVSQIKAGSLVVMWIAGQLLAACSNPLASNLSTPLPPEHLPTVVALTLSARGINPATPTQTSPSPVIDTLAALSPTPLVSATSTIIIETDPAPRTAIPNPTISATSFLSSTGLTVTPTIESQASPVVTDPLGATNTPAPPIPDARIQIYRLGELSKVISPLDVSLRLTCGDGKVVRIELHGEDGRLLARDVRNYDKVPWEAARIGMSLDFEISAAAELGRLVVSAEDLYGRLIEINSVNLILLSQGMTELNPASALQQRIIIQEPAEKTLIQGGKLIVSGRARLETTQPLRVMLVSENGRILGQRLAGVSVLIPGDYGTFVAEATYSVTEVTPALLIVFEEGGVISEVSSLTSLKIILAP